MGTSPETKHLLLIDEDEVMRDRVASTLIDAGYQVVAVARPELAPAGEPHDAIVAALSGGSGRPLGGLGALVRRFRGTPVLVLADAGDLPFAVKSLQQGVEDYLLRPPDPFELRKRLARILDRHDLDSRISFFQDELSKKYGVTSFEVHSPPMRNVMDRVLRVAPLRSTVLISGESGVGKELVARAVHFNSPRRDRPFIALNCAAIPASLIESELFGHEKGSFTGAHARARGKFEIAHQGTLFLDEIGEMEAATQAKLLRVLEEREFMRIGGDRSIRFDVRLIAATNADLESLVIDGRFRQDLYYRLKVVAIKVPPLRDRRADLPYLVQTFLEQLSNANAIPRRVIAAEAMAALADYHWPGNVRELKNLLESLLVSTPGEVIRLADLPAAIRRDSTPAPSSELRPGTTLAQMEHELILRTLEHTGGNRTHSALLLGIGVRTLQRKIKTYGIRVQPKRRRSRVAR